MGAQDITIEPILPPIVDPRRPVEIDSFRIAYRGQTPDTVAAVANELAREFIRENLEVRSADAGQRPACIHLCRAGPVLPSNEHRISAGKPAVRRAIPDNQADARGKKDTTGGNN